MLGERIHGVNDYKELPKDFEKLQFEDINYKVGDGESRKEVTDRMLNIFNIILNDNIGKNILIVSHATSISYLLSNWCNVKYQGNYSFNNKVFFDGNWDYCETFKLTFEDNELIDVINIKR